MANTADTSKSGHVLQVTYSGNGADWNYKDDGGFSPGAIKVAAIIWHPTADGDTLVINEGGIDGPSIVHWEASDSGVQPQIVFSPPVRLRPYIDLTDQTFNTITSTKIIFILA
jgi:hypothetical protein